ncbi:predicted protein [Postia placenta Mad-698-R]|nr:predicted protein [Postia placenta Mad-698-R]
MAGRSMAEAVLSGECPSAVCESECKQDGEPMTSDIAVSCESGGVDGTHGHSLATTGDNTRSADPGPIDRFRSPCRSIYAPLSGGVQGAILNAFQGALGTSQWSSSKAMKIISWQSRMLYDQASQRGELQLEIRRWTLGTRVAVRGRYVAAIGAVVQKAGRGRERGDEDTDREGRGMARALSRAARRFRPWTVAAVVCARWRQLVW